MNKHSERSPLGLYTIGVAALFLAGFFLLVIFGAQSYRGTVAVQSGNNADRTLLGYFGTCLSANDSKGAVSLQDSEFGQVLIVEEGHSGFGLRIFCADGMLMEEYAALDAPLSAELAVSLGVTQTFRVEEVSQDLLRITTDAGSTLVHLRSAGGVKGS